MKTEITPIDLYRAIDEARRISAAGGSFSLKFRKWNRATKRGGDLAYIAEARCRPKASDEEVADASHKLFFTDISTGQARNCWHALIVEFNGQPVILS